MNDEYRIFPGMVLAEDRGTSISLWCVCGVRSPRKKDGAVTATLRNYSGAPGSEVVASGEATATFPGGMVRHPFHVVTAADVVRGKWPDRIPKEADA